MKVTITDAAGCQLVCQANEKATVRDLKLSLERTQGVAAGLQQLRLGSQLLNDSSVVSEVAAQSGFTGDELAMTVTYQMSGAGGFVTTGGFEPHCKICCAYCGCTSLFTTCQCCCIYVGH